MGQYFEYEGEQILYPIHGREDIKLQFPESKIDFYSYEDFARMDFQTLLNIKNLESETLKATTFASSYIENLGEGKYKIKNLPKNLQVSPINDLLVADFDQDGQSEFLAVGNDFTTESNYGQFDALTGLLVETDGEQFEIIPSRNSGFKVEGQSHHMINITDAKGRNLIIATQNNEPVKVFEIK
jgi:hypothetical protein